MPFDLDINLLLVPIAYLLGSIPTGIIVVKAFGGIDPRSSGSKNIGATNVGRTSGKTAGIITLLGDVLKGAVPVIITFYITSEPKFISLVGLSAFLGHIFPVFLKFKGGKGVATALGVMVVISPISTALSAAVFVAALLIKRYVSLGSILAAISLPVFLFIFTGTDYGFLGIIIGAIVVKKHRENIKRLLEGNENRFF